MKSVREGILCLKLFFRQALATTNWLLLVSNTAAIAQGLVGQWSSFSTSGDQLSSNCLSASNKTNNLQSDFPIIDQWLLHKWSATSNWQFFSPVEAYNWRSGGNWSPLVADWLVNKVNQAACGWSLFCEWLASEKTGSGWWQLINHWCQWLLTSCSKSQAQCEWGKLH